MENVPVDDFKNLTSPYSVDNFEVQIPVCLFSYDNRSGSLTSYDNVGNRTFMQRAHTSGAPTDVYQYDNLYQLTQVWYGADATEPAAITTYEHLQAYTLYRLCEEGTLD